MPEFAHRRDEEEGERDAAEVRRYRSGGEHDLAQCAAAAVDNGVGEHDADDRTDNGNDQ